MKKSDFGIEIKQVSNGYVITDNEGEISVCEEREEDLIDEMSVDENLLWAVIEFFGLNGSRHDQKRVRVIEEAGDKYVLKEDERFVKKEYLVVKKK